MYYHEKFVVINRYKHMLICTKKKFLETKLNPFPASNKFPYSKLSNTLYPNLT